jgi:hypothetical protein
MLLIGGGGNDFNLDRLLSGARSKGIEIADARVVAGAPPPSFTWHVDAHAFKLAGRTIAPAAAFVRYDVFGSSSHLAKDADFVAAAWYAALDGYIANAPNVRAFNRCYRSERPLKPQQLALARHFGLRVPDTVVTNDVAVLRELARAGSIAKPVGGGTLTEELASVLALYPPDAATLPAPAFVQPRLVGPEMRVFVIGSKAVGFRVESPSLDYREHQDAVVSPTDVPPEIHAGVVALASHMGLDFAAADLKTDPDTGALTFLEINSGPMFARFDDAAGGGLCAMMLDWLMLESLSDYPPA